MYQNIFADQFRFYETLAIQKNTQVEIRRSITTSTDTPNPVGYPQVSIGKDLPLQMVYVSPVRDLIKSANHLVLAVAAALPIDPDHDAHIDNVIKEEFRKPVVRKLERRI